MTASPATPDAPIAPAEQPAGKRRRWSAAGWLGIAVVACMLLAAVFGPALAPYSAGKVVDLDAFGPMSWKHPLGTDYLGRDMLSRVLHGARYTVGLALAATLIACVVGMLLGLIAATLGGWFDFTLSRFLDALISMPSLLFGLVVVAAFGSSIPVLIATAAIIYTPGSYRIGRSLAVNVNAMDFVTVARARGEKGGYIMVSEIMPNIIGPALTDFGLRFVFVILLLSRLSFLGLGIQPPHADWGSLVRENISGLVYGAPAVVAPAAAIAALTIAVNLVIDNVLGRNSGSLEGH
jgi:peptide/nickel transport system permease protein